MKLSRLFIGVASVSALGLIATTLLNSRADDWGSRLVRRIQDVSGLPVNHREHANQIGISLSPDGNNLLFSADGVGGCGIFNLNLKTQKVSTVIDTELSEYSPAFIPGSKNFVYSVIQNDGARLYLAPLVRSGGTARPITQVTSSRKSSLQFFDTSAVASADGKYIYFNRASLHRPYSMGGMTWDHWDLYRLRLSDKTVTQLTHSNFYSMSPPQVSSSGEVAFSYDAGEEQSGVVLVEVNGKVQMVKSGAESVTSPSFFGKANRLIFISDAKQSYRYELCTSNRQFAPIRTLTHEGSYIVFPQAHGNTVYFLNDPERTGDYELWRVNLKPDASATVGKPQKVADASLFFDPLKWKSTASQNSR